MNPPDLIFDTRVDTHKIYVSMKTKFVIRKIKSRDWPVYLHITADYKRERLKLDLNVPNHLWCKKNQRVKSNNIKKLEDLNLILDNIDAKITNIKTVYRLSEKILTPELLKEELINNLPRVNFCSFFEKSLEDEKNLFTKGTYKRHKSVLKKLKDYNSNIIFHEINDDWFKKYRSHLKTINNKETTINSNIIAIKKYLRIAVKKGIKIGCNLDDVKSGPTNGNRTSLTPTELKQCFDVFNSGLINESYHLILGYFLFSCMTGLRFSDVMQIDREHIQDNFIQLVSKKTGKPQTVVLNNNAQKIVVGCKRLFEEKFTNQHINDELKKIMAFLGIRKKVTFHVGRHTFATSFLRAGGKVEDLQKLLRHSSINETMIYVHITQQEANSKVSLLDGIF